MVGLGGKGAFVMGATGSLTLIGWSNTRVGLLGIRLGEGPSIYEVLPPMGRWALLLWMGAAALVGLALPALALALWGRQGAVRRALLPYVGILLVQLLTEWWFTREFGWHMGPLVGLIYTAYRIAQLGNARRAFAGGENLGPGQRAVQGLLGLASIFWSANLVLLVMVVLSRVVSF